MIKQFSLYLALVLIGCVLSLGTGFACVSSKNVKLSKQNAKQECTIAELNAAKDQLKKQAQKQAELEADSNKIRDTLQERIVVVEKEVQTSSWGPAVHTALDQLRDD